MVVIVPVTEIAQHPHQHARSLHARVRGEFMPLVTTYIIARAPDKPHNLVVRDLINMIMSD